MAELDWTQAPVIVTPGGGIVTGYAGDPFYAQAGAVAPKTDRAVAAALLAPTYDAPGGGRVTGYAGDPFYSQPGATAPKTNRDGTSNPILAQQRADTVARALNMGGAHGKLTGGGGDLETALVGTGPVGNRMTPNASGYGFGGNMTGWGGVPFGYVPRGTTALGAIDAAATPQYVASMKFASPQAGRGGVVNLDFNPMSDVAGQNFANSTGRPVRFANGTTFRPSAAPQSGVRAPMNRTQQALAAVSQATYTPVPQVQSNGVANPAYRDYSGTRQSEGGGIAPQASSGSFTDSLGGVYYDRHL